MSDTTLHPIIFFDGLCNLCTASVQFVIRHDRKKQFRFASLQSEAGQQILKIHPSHGTFILAENGNIYTRSSAALRVTKRLNGLWPSMFGLLIIPPFIRNAVYSYIAKNRYKWFGKKEECWIPTPELNDLFLN